MKEILNDYLVQILALVVSGVSAFIAYAVAQAKTKWKDYVNNKEVHTIIDDVVRYVEQQKKNGIELSSAEKKKMARKMAQEWLTTKGFTISDTELDILIEACVNGITIGIKNGTTN